MSLELVEFLPTGRLTEALADFRRQMPSTEFRSRVADRFRFARPSRQLVRTRPR